MLEHGESCQEAVGRIQEPGESCQEAVEGMPECPTAAAPLRGGCRLWIHPCHLSLHGPTWIWM